MHAISTIFPNTQRRGSRFHLGQSWWRRIQTFGMPEDHRQELGYFEVVGVVFGLSLPSDEVGTSFADEIMSTIPADDCCRKFADYIVDHYIDSECYFAPDLWASSPQQSPTTTNSAESLHADYTRGELDQLGYILRVGYRFAP